MSLNLLVSNLNKSSSLWTYLSYDNDNDNDKDKFGWEDMRFEFCFPSASFRDPSTAACYWMRFYFPNETRSLEFNVPSITSLRIGWFHSSSLPPIFRNPTQFPPLGTKEKSNPVLSCLFCAVSLGGLNCYLHSSAEQSSCEVNPNRLGA